MYQGAKYKIIGTLTQRAKTVCTDPELLQKELTHLRNAMGKSKYPSWAINKVQNKVLNSNQEEHGINQHKQQLSMTSQPTIKTQVQPTQDQDPPTPQDKWSFHTCKAQPKVSNTFVVSMISRYITKETQPSYNYS